MQKKWKYDSYVQGLELDKHNWNKSYLGSTHITQGQITGKFIAFNDPSAH